MVNETREEFVFLLPDTDKEAAFCLAERLRAGRARLPVKGAQTPTLRMEIAAAFQNNRLSSII